MKKVLSFFSVLFGAAEAGIALGYTVFSMFFLTFGYDDYLINRRWIVPAGCFCAIVAFHFLIGMAFQHMSRYFEDRPVLFGEVGCAIEGCDVEAIVLGDWRAGGIACVNEGGLMKDCRFAGTVESGRCFEEGEGEERWAVENMDTGGICIVNTGSIQNCRNEGAILSGAITDTRPVQYNCGGIVGAVRGGGRVETCENLGRVEGPQICGGIAGISRGDIRECSNMGKVHVKRKMSEMAEDTTPGE